MLHIVSMKNFRSFMKIVTHLVEWKVFFSSSRRLAAPKVEKYFGNVRWIWKAQKLRFLREKDALKRIRNWRNLNCDGLSGGDGKEVRKMFWIFSEDSRESLMRKVGGKFSWNKATSLTERLMKEHFATSFFCKKFSSSFVKNFVRYFNNLWIQFWRDALRLFSASSKN